MIVVLNCRCSGRTRQQRAERDGIKVHSAEMTTLPSPLRCDKPYDNHLYHSALRAEVHIC